MRVLVTGANGFIGKHVCQSLLENGHSVSAAVRRRDCAPAGTREIVIGGIGPATDWDEALSGQDAVIHLAARVHVMEEKSLDPSEEFNRINVEGTRTLIARAADSSVNNFVFLSSIKVNGESTSGRPFRVMDRPCPKDPYGISKLKAENVLNEFGRRAGISIVNIRPVLVYGPGVGGNMRKLLKLVDLGAPVPLGSIKNKRTLCSIDNLTHLVISSLSYKGQTPVTVLAGDESSHSTADLIRSIAVSIGKPAHLVPIPAAMLRGVSKIMNRSATIERLTGSLEIEAGSDNDDFIWRPNHSFEEGIRKLGRWYRGSFGARSVGS